MVLVWITVGLIVLATVSFIYLSRVRSSSSTTSAAPYWTVLLPSVWTFVFVVASGGLCLYHTQLIGMNLTTNEHANWRRYSYLMSSSSSSNNNGQHVVQYKNPYKQPGGFFGNIHSRCIPGPHSYELPNHNEHDHQHHHYNGRRSNGSTGSSSTSSSSGTSSSSSDRDPLMKEV
mmetsp:Transcript_29497/g.45202  ORF Transcript_29497/g.45202 Transcript_29497/m.45202 type:complete len:174 (-) Transcript_29497:19-540(-)